MIGVFDSGVGGLSVLREIHRACPHQPTLYVADQAHVPYGPRPESELREYAGSICDYLIGRGANVIVVACNTATAAAINWLRETYPSTPFVGMEPAIKPAAQLTKSGRIGVLATAGTFKSQRYSELMNRFAQNVELFENSCVGLVEQIEYGELESDKTIGMLNEFINPMLEKEIDTLILGCTHYPFVLPAIKTIVGESVTVIDPAPAVAQQTARLILANQNKTRPEQSPGVQLREYGTNGDLANFIKSVNRMQNIAYTGSNPDKIETVNIVKNHHLNFYQKVHNN